MVRPQYQLPNGQGAPEEQLCSGRLTVRLEQPTQVGEAPCGTGVVGPPHPLPDGQGSLQQRAAVKPVVPRVASVGFRDRMGAHGDAAGGCHKT